VYERGRLWRTDVVRRASTTSAAAASSSCNLGAVLAKMVAAARPARNRLAVAGQQWSTLGHVCDNGMDVARRSAGDLFFLSVSLHAQLGHAEIPSRRAWSAASFHGTVSISTSAKACLGRWELARLVTEKRRPEAGHGVEVTGLIHDHLCGPRWDVRLENCKTTPPST
jgi:hypothetical protein